MNLNFIYNRTKDIIINPNIEWIKIKSEDIENSDSKLNLLIPYSILYALGSILGNLFFNHNNMGSGLNLFHIFFLAANSFLLFYLGTYFSALIINELQNNFGCEKNIIRINTLVINSLIPFFLFTVVYSIFPQFTVLFIILGFYSMYVFWFGISNLLSIHDDKMIAFFILSSMLVGIIFVFLKFILGSIFLSISGLVM